MCRNIKKLRRPESTPADSELRDAALQFVRKVSGFRAPSQKNKQAFERAVDGVTREIGKMFERLGTDHRDTQDTEMGTEKT